MNNKKYISLILFFYFANSLIAEEIRITPRDVLKINEIIEKMKKKDTLMFSSGIYNLEKPVYIKGKNFIELRAEKDVFIVLKENLEIFILNNSHNVVISGIHAKHVMPYESKYCTSGVMIIYNSHDILVSNVELNGSGIVGILIQNSASITVTNSHLHDNSKSAIEFKGNVDNIVIQNNKIDNNPVFIQSAIALEKLTDQVMIKNNDVIIK